MKDKLWMCGQIRAETEKGRVCEFQGVFSTEEKAIQACKNRNFFIAPFILDEEIPEETTEWPGIYYPKAEKKKIT